MRGLTCLCFACSVLSWLVMEWCSIDYQNLRGPSVARRFWGLGERTWRRFYPFSQYYLTIKVDSEAVATLPFRFTGITEELV